MMLGSGMYAEETTTSSETTVQNSFDTLSYTQEEYESYVPWQSSAYSTASSSISDETTIENVCRVYITSSRAYVREPELYSNETFIAADSIDNDTIEYRMSEFEYLNKLHDELGETIVYDNISFDGFTVSIDGNDASASIIESYTYYIDDEFGVESFRMRKYFFDLSKNEEIWEINNVTTNDAWEVESDFLYEAIDVENAVAQATQPVIADVTEIVDEDDASLTATSYNYWTYSASTAISYAETYYNSTNTAFDRNDSDCQNFVSQCVWAGLGGTSKSSITVYPAVSTSSTGTYSTPYLWCHNVASTYYSDYRLNWTWDNVQGFANLISLSSSSHMGPYGTVRYGSTAISNATAGSALFLTYNSSATSVSDLNHAMFITKVGSSKTVSNIYIAAHTCDSNTAYTKLTEYYSSASASVLATATISCGYYYTSQ